MLLILTVQQLLTSQVHFWISDLRCLFFFIRGPDFHFHCIELLSQKFEDSESLLHDPTEYHWASVPPKWESNVRESLAFKSESEIFLQFFRHFHVMIGLLDVQLCSKVAQLDRFHYCAHVLHREVHRL
ncbi:MAG: hypothetical protein EZS28_006085 [Streblomastix strix]|uniref:Uncharacterized protein n=1 Tax=Streblomastix strix TaxID=222440 RepID=A0A5J4WUZ0_9EUKA|nr:MAG: hypothetical protein EZS28_006085 [Streblomastix strix]